MLIQTFTVSSRIAIDNVISKVKQPFIDIISTTFYNVFCKPTWLISKTAPVFDDWGKIPISLQLVKCKMQVRRRITILLGAEMLGFYGMRIFLKW